MVGEQKANSQGPPGPVGHTFSSSSLNPACSFGFFTSVVVARSARTTSNRSAAVMSPRPLENQLPADDESFAYCG